MGDDAWTYRFGIFDGPTRMGALEFDGSRFDLPVVLDTLDHGPGFNVIPIRGEWKDVRIRVNRLEKEHILPERLVKAHQNALSSLGLRALFPPVTYTDIHLIGHNGMKEGPMDILTLPHFPLVALDPREALNAMMELRSSDPVHHPLLVPSVPNSRNIELLLYFGLEIFDTVSFRLDGMRSIFHDLKRAVPYGRILRSGGPGRICGCSACRSLTEEQDEEKVLTLIGDHNVGMLVKRLFRAMSYLEEGRLRELVMGSLAGNPEWLSAMRSIEKRADDNILGMAPSWRNADEIRVTYREDLNNPDFQLWERRIIDDYTPLGGRGVLLLLPCSARKPYSTSRTHQRIRDALKPIKGWRKAVHQIVITSPLGAVPMELEDLYPASHYDIPVTGDWFPEEIERTRKVVLSIIDKGDYGSIISFHHDGSFFFPEGTRDGELKGIPFTDVHAVAASMGRDPNDVLLEHLGPLVEGYPKSGNSELQELLGQIRFSCAMDLTGIEGLQVKWSRRGKELRLGRDVLFVFKKGGPVPTTRGGEIIWRTEGNGKRVFIDDFKPRGTVFSQGVTGSSGKIRTGDIVLVGSGESYRGVGRAMVPSGVMVCGVRGPAVQMIHTA
jgi:archaeosine synthase